MKTEVIKIGEVGVDSGQLILLDPSYIEGQYRCFENHPADHGHEIYAHIKDGKLWQFVYGNETMYENVNPFPGTYGDIIPEYGMCPNDLIKNNLFAKTDIDPRPHIEEGEFSYRGICKTTGSENQSGQINHITGIPSGAVAFHSGLGDGCYSVYAEFIVLPNWGKRIKKVWVELITDAEVEEIKQEYAAENN